MSVLKSLKDRVYSLVYFILDQFRNLQRREGTSLYFRLIAAITLVSIVMVIIFAVKLIRSHSRVTLVLATAGQGGEYYSFGENLMQVINDNQRRIVVETKPTLGSCENMKLLENDDVDLAIVQHDTPAKPSVQAIASLFPEALHLIVDKNIKSIPDMKGKRIAVIANLLGENNDPNDPKSFFHQFIKRHSLISSIEVAKTHSLDEAAAAFLDEKVDAVILFIAVGNQCATELLTQQKRPAKLLPIDANAVETWYPYVEDSLIQKAAFWAQPPTPDKDIHSVSVQSLLLTHKRVDKKAIMEITRILHEHRNKLMVNNPRAATIRFPSSGQNLGIPLHIGAKAFYDRERPGFMVTYSDPLTLLLSIAILCASGMWQIRLSLEQKQKKRADMYNLELLDLIEHARKIENLHELRQVRQRLFNIFRRVLEDLDNNEISVESFQLFTFPCEVALSAMRHREWMLTNSSFRDVKSRENDLVNDSSTNE
jgi:TRAP transporter TAXI family solute receptor